MEYRLADLVRIHAFGATPTEARALSSQLGLALAAPTDAPDIVVRFVDQVEHGRLTFLGGDAACSDDGFFIVRGASGVLAQIPLDSVGAGPEIIIRHGYAVPLLEEIMNLTVLANGGLALHAAAFELDGSGSALVGWPRGGKTTALLGFAAEGARLIAEDWTFVGRDGRSLYGALQRIPLSDRHLRGLGSARARLARPERLQLRLQAGFERVGAFLARASPGRLIHPLERATAAAVSRLEVEAAPGDLFAGAEVGNGAQLDRIFLVLASPTPTVTVERVDERDVARRLVHMLEFERLRFTGYLAKFRFAFPHTVNTFLENPAQLEEKRLAAAVQGKPAYAVRHPHGVDSDVLAGAMRPYCA